MVGVILRGSVFYLVKRVPVEFAHLETRAIVRRSLRTGDRREAEKRATRETAAMLARWEAGRAIAAADPATDQAAEAAAAARIRQALRGFYWEQVEADEISADTANKYLHYISGMIRTYVDLSRIDWRSPFGGLSLRSDGGAERRRLPLSDAWIRTHLAAPEPLPGLNEEARDVLLAMVNTGARPSEIICLLPHHIRLDDPIPHVVVTPEGRVLKNRPSERKLPLVGVSLAAMRRHPGGFPRYRGKAGWSNLVNQYLRANGALEADQSAYSLRHAFEDRMLAAGAVDRLAADLMGHAVRRERYGAGASLALKHTLLQRIAI